MTLGNHETLVDTIIILSRREPPHVPARPILYTEASSRVRTFFSSVGPAFILYIILLGQSSSAITWRSPVFPLLPQSSPGDAEDQPYLRGTKREERRAANQFGTAPRHSRLYQRVSWLLRALLPENSRFCYRFFIVCVIVSIILQSWYISFPPLETVQPVSILCMDGAGCDFCFHLIRFLSARISLARSLPLSQ